MAQSIIKRGDQKIRSAIRRFHSRRQVSKSLKRISGEKFIDLPHGEVVAVLLGRNMGHYLEEFYEYYRNIGVKYFIYADNGSDDNSMDIVAKWKNSILLYTDLNFKVYQNLIRQEISTKYCADGWRLAVDPDELFDFVGSDRMSVQGLGRCLLEDGFTGLVGQMLDLVSNKPVSEVIQNDFSNTISSNIYYSLDNISEYAYYDEMVPFSGLVRNNTILDSRISWKFGGLRNIIFGENCCLTKHPFFYYRNGVIPFEHPHLTTGLKIADFTALLKHYKFSGDFIAREGALLREDRIAHNETAKRASVIQGHTGFRFDTTNLYDDPSPGSVHERGFLVMSDRAKKRFM